jgi:hypothetical protein
MRLPMLGNAPTVGMGNEHHRRLTVSGKREALVRYHQGHPNHEAPT